MPFSRMTYATVLVIPGVILIGRWAFAQNPATITEQLTTAERIERSKWWPTDGRAGKNEYAGSRACEQCHYAIVKSQSRHSMAKASVPAEISDALRDQAGRSFRLGDYEYKVIRGANGAFQYTASNPGQTILLTGKLGIRRG